TARIVRRRLTELLATRFLNQIVLQYSPRGSGQGFNVFYPARRGAEFLAEHFQDQRFLAVSTAAPDPHHVFHWLEITNAHLLLDEAVALAPAQTLERWVP